MHSNVGDKIADNVASFVGSWPFVILMTSFLALWIIVNIVGIFGLRWDAYPFILLNLCLSFLAGYTGPFIMMSQNRAAAKDRVRDDLEASEVSELYEINKQQIEILNQQTEILELLHKQED